MSLPPTVEELRAQGFLIQIGGTVDYHTTPLQHPVLHYSIGKLLITDTPEDAFLQSAAGRAIDEEVEEEEETDEEEAEPSKARESGNLIDKLLTTNATYDARAIPEIPFTVQLKTKVDVVHYRDWKGYRVISADSYSKSAAKQCKAEARAHGLTPILEYKLLRAIARVELVRARLELAGLSFKPETCQVPVYWVEIASDGTPVQCAARLDQLIATTDEDGDDVYMIRDLKETRTLRRKQWANTVYEFRYHMQAWVYTRAVFAATGVPADFQWVLVRSGGSVPQVARRKPSQEWLQMGKDEWSFAVDQWAKCVTSGMWPGWELLGVETTFPEPYHLTRHEEWKQQLEDEQEATDGAATAA
jgi:hypothetical protein